MAFVSIISRPIIEFDNHASEFTWDMFLHFPIVSIDFVAEKAGINLIEHTGSEAEAENLLKQLAKVAKDYIMSRVPLKSREYQEFRLSRDLDVLYEVLEFQIAFVIAATTTGSVYDLYSINRIGAMKPGIVGIENAFAILSTKFRTFEKVPRSLYRVGY